MSVKMLRYALVVSVLALAGCAATESKPLTADEQTLQYAKRSCLEQTMTMGGSDGPAGQSAVFNNLSLTSYFQWCMQNYGFTKEEIDAIWY